LIGNPLDTTVAAAALVFGGVLERHPRLAFCMVHGGGFAPYQAARWTHGWQVRQEPKVHLKNPPQASLDRLNYDTVLHDPRPLQFLVDLVGPARVLLGSDYPFDMGQSDIGIVRALKVSRGDKASILFGNALRLVGEPTAGKAGIQPISAHKKQTRGLLKLALVRTARRYSLENYIRRTEAMHQRNSFGC
jgi:aminocarboxymuconate-semialdehyde decarboxylase